MFKKIVTTQLLILSLHFAFAQTTSFQKSLYARFNFLGVIDPIDHNVSFGAEYVFRSKLSVGADVAYIFASDYIYDIKKTRGILFRPFLRFYPNGKPDFFIHAEAHYKFVSYTLEDWVGKDPVNGVPAYEEFQKFQYRKRVMGIHVLTGERFSISKNKLLSMEVTAGLGIRWRKQFAKDVLYDPFSAELFQRKLTAVVPVNVRFCYRIR
jgi:hypothetical protein